MFYFTGYIPAEMAADRQFGEGLADIVLQAVVGRGGGDIGEIFFQGDDVGVDAHAIVIQDDQQVGIRYSGVIHAFEGQACRHRSVPDDGYGLTVRLAVVFGRHRHAQGRADVGGRMPYAKAVILALAAFGKSAQAIIFTIAAEIIAAPREDLMPVGLVAYIPYQLIIGSIEDVMEGHREFDHSQAGCEMASMNTDGVNDILTQFGRHLVYVISAEFF